MITKERLEELIEQCETIYSVDDAELLEIKANELYYSKSNDNWQYNKYFFVYEFYEDDLFENKEDAEWHREFGCIERTERLELPTWEEIQKYERFDFKDKYNHSYTLHYISGFKNLAISGWSTEYYAPATKENYTLACRKAKELFLGEKK